MEHDHEHPLDSIQRLGVQARLTVETLTQYYLAQLAPEHFRSAPNELAAALAKIRRALTCRGLVAELCADEQTQVLEVLNDLLPAPPDEQPSSRTGRIDALLQEVAIGMICWHARTATTFALWERDRDPLPACERFARGDAVIVRGKDWPADRYYGCTGTFWRYSDPRIGHRERCAVVHFDSHSEEAVLYVRPADLELAPEEEELGSYRPLSDYRLERETWGHFLRYRLSDSSVWRRVTLSAGRADDLDVFTDGSAVYVLSVNDLLPSVGVQVFLDGEELEHFFYQEGRVEEELGADFWNLAPVEKLERIVAGYVPRDVESYEQLGTWSRDGFTLQLSDTGRVDRLGKSILAYELFDEHYGRKPIFQGADFHCSPSQDRASDGAVADVLGFLSLRPEDSDAERFATYTLDQHRWYQQRAAVLARVAEQFEQRQRWRDLHAAGDTEEAVVAMARRGRAEDLFEVLDMDIFETYDLVAELCRRREDALLSSLLGELHYLRNVELVGGEEELARLYE